jgi:hypothetical protein
MLERVGNMELDPRASCRYPATTSAGADRDETAVQPRSIPAQNREFGLVLSGKVGFARRCSSPT